MRKPNKIFIAYYYNEENDKDAEIYIGNTGTETEFIEYWKKAYDDEMKNHSIDGIYPVIKEMGIDGNVYKLIIK